MKKLKKYSHLKMSLKPDFTQVNIVLVLTRPRPCSQDQDLDNQDRDLDDQDRVFGSQDQD